MKKHLGEAGAWLLIIVGIAFIPAMIYLMGSWTDSNLDYWLSYYKGHAVHVPLWLATILSLVFNGLALFANLIAEIAKFVV